MLIAVPNVWTGYWGTNTQVAAPHKESRWTLTLLGLYTDNDYLIICNIIPERLRLNDLHLRAILVTSVLRCCRHQSIIDDKVSTLC